MKLQTENSPKRHRYQKVLIIISSVVAGLMVAVFLLGTFYGKRDEFQLGPYPVFPPRYNLPPVTIYRIGNEIYVPVDIDESSNQVARNVPYYYGKLSDAAYEMVFDGKIERGSEAGVTDGDFLNDVKDHPKNIPAYTVRIGDMVYGGNDFRILANDDGDQLAARIDVYYSEKMRDDWYGFAAELDIIFNVKLRKIEPEVYGIAPIDLKESMYYTQSDWADRRSFWHEFKKHLAFFASDVKELFT